VAALKSETKANRKLGRLSCPGWQIGARPLADESPHALPGETEHTARGRHESQSRAWGSQSCGGEYPQTTKSVSRLPHCEQRSRAPHSGTSSGRSRMRR